MSISERINGFKSKITKEKILKLIKNKFFIATIFFLILIFFVDDKNFFEIGRSKSKLYELEKEEADLKKKIEAQKNELIEIDKNENIEKIAREQYLMKKKDEDLYIIVDKEDE